MRGPALKSIFLIEQSLASCVLTLTPGRAPLQRAGFRDGVCKSVCVRVHVCVHPCVLVAWCSYTYGSIKTSWPLCDTRRRRQRIQPAELSLSLSLSSTHTPLTHTHLTAEFEKQIPSSIMSAVATPSPPRPTCDACVFSPFRCIARGREGGEQRERGRGREGGTFRRAYSIVSLQALPPVSGRRGRGRGCSLHRTATAAC